MPSTLEGIVFLKDKNNANHLGKPRSFSLPIESIT